MPIAMEYAMDYADGVCRWSMPMEYAMEYADAEEFLMEYAVSP